MDKVVKGPGEAGDLDLHQTFEDVNETMQTFIESASVDKVYGQPVEIGETKIIPTSENLVVLGFGAGMGYGRGDFEDEESPSNGQGTGEGGGGGGGGGGRTLSRPVAIVIASPAGVRVEPVVDRTKIVMAALTAAGFVAGMFFRMSRGPRG
ncbi:MAG: spore germination protein GerW family protein [Anaerolineales bacterium]